MAVRTQRGHHLNRGRLASIWLVCLFALSQTALAGSTLDHGQLSGIPADGTVTYVAYLSETNGDEILTEDGYNAGLGTNQGYQAGYWLLALSSFDTEDAGDEVHIDFAGIGVEQGKTGTLTFNWDDSSGFTDHGIVAFEPASPIPAPSDLVATPAITQGTLLLTWTDHSNGSASYRLYRSTQSSGANNGASNGHYYRMVPFEYGCSNGTCRGYDRTAVLGMNWYVVIVDAPLSRHSNEAGADGSEVGGTVVSSFTATPLDSQILLEWETEREIDNLGFNLYRADRPDGMATGTYVQINDALIPGTGSPSQGDRYDSVDEGPSVGVQYYYWLEDVNLQIGETLHGPVTAALEGHRLYLPLVERD